MNALLIPQEGPVEEIELDGTLEQLQKLVGGYIEFVPLPGFLNPNGEHTVAYVNEDGKYNPAMKPNMRATDFMVPGIGLFVGDYIAGPMLLVAVNKTTGEHEGDLSQRIIDRVRLIEQEAG